MKLHRYLVRPASPWAAPTLRSDTLYGLLLCRVAERDGPAACTSLIEAFRAKQPPFILSSLMPAGRLPMPLLPPPPRGTFRTWVEKGDFSQAGSHDLLFSALQALKKFRKLAWLPCKVWENHACCLSLRDLFAWYWKDEKGPEKKAPKDSSFEPHVAVDRQTGSARAGALFFTRLRYFPPDAAFHLYARTDSPEALLELLNLAGEFGFGKGASTGKGRFMATWEKDFDPAPLEQPAQGPGDVFSLLLSACAAPDMRGLEGWYKLNVKHGKAGPLAANPFKNPFLCLQEGSLLKQLPARAWVLSNLNQDAAVVQITPPLTLPCRLAPEKEER